MGYTTAELRSFTESISLSKYPAYADYRQRTSRLIPLPPRSRA